MKYVIHTQTCVISASNTLSATSSEISNSAVGQPGHRIGIVLSKSGSGKGSEPELNRTEPEVQVRGSANTWTKLKVRVRGSGTGCEVRTCPVIFWQNLNIIQCQSCSHFTRVQRGLSTILLHCSRDGYWGSEMIYCSHQHNQMTHLWM